MLETRKVDLIWSWTMIGLNVLAMLLGLIPGFIKMYDEETASYVGACLLNAPSGNIMSSMSALLLLIFAYCLILCICYLRSQSVGTVKAIMVFAIGCCVVSALALLPRDTIKAMPYAIIPGLFAVLAVAAGVRGALEQKRLDALCE